MTSKKGLTNMGGKRGAKYITAGKLIELLSTLAPGTKVVANDHYGRCTSPMGSLTNTLA